MKDTNASPNLKRFFLSYVRPPYETDIDEDESSYIETRYLLNEPPDNALVISVDEKPSIQALERATGYVETYNDWTFQEIFAIICPWLENLSDYHINA